ncbi:hypothetical protein TNCV_4676561, partial [Trichonephila clavipes]
MKEVAEESMKMAAVEEYSSSPDNLLTVSGDGNWKTRRHSSLIGVCTGNRAETEALRIIFEARGAKKIKRVKKLSCFRNREGISYDPGAFSV